MYCRYFLVGNLDETVAGGHIQTVVQDLGEYCGRNLIQSVTGDSGSLQNSLQCAGSYGVVFSMNLEHNAGIFHRVSQNLCFPVMLIKLHVQVTKLAVLFDGLKLETFGGGYHPSAVFLAFF